MPWLTDGITLFIYFGALALLMVYGMHRYYMAFLFLRHRKDGRITPKPFNDPPMVTVQLPLFNERYVVRRLIEAVSRFDYPRDRFEIQVLDDSTDETQEIAKQLVNELTEQGINIVYLRRKTREGFKAGALNHGLQSAKGELIAIFDADFIPPADFLKKTVDYFSDNAIGMVQARWSHLNGDFSMFTHLQSVLLDGHFIIEHTARNRSGRFFNFNGTAGIWKKQCLLDAGSWQYDTLTEDLDISYRAQLKGWKFIFLKDFQAPAELPVEMNAFKSQQHRWAKGSIQTAVKLLPLIFRSQIPWKTKLESAFHLTNNLAYPLLVVVAVLMFPTMVIRFSQGWIDTLLIDVPFLFGATFSIMFFYSVSQNEIHGNWFVKLQRLPMLMILGIGIAPNNARAVFEALTGSESEFKRTPKFGVRKRADTWKEKTYQGEFCYTTVIEIAMALYFAVSLVLAIEIGIYLSVPFLALFFLGFAYVPAVSIFQATQRMLLTRRGKTVDNPGFTHDNVIRPLQKGEANEY